MKGSSNILVWIIVIAIALGFGKCGSALGLNLAPANDYVDDRHSRRRGGHDYYPKPIGFGNFGLGKYGNLFGGNLLFILLVIALLFVCKDSDGGYLKEEKKDDYFEADSYEDEKDDYEDDGYESEKSDYETEESKY